MTPLIAPSILSADFARLGDDVQAVLDAGADIVHFDVMDNHFVPNLTIGPLLCDALKNYGIEAPIDVHLMVEPVDRIIPDFVKAGANYITFHPEASRHVDRSLGLIRDEGCKAGLVFNPATPLTWLEHVMDKVDMVLIMSVNPGFGGQKFIPAALDKLCEARKLIDDSGFEIRLEIDGGVKIDNIGEIAAAGADTFVAGSAIFGSEDYRKTITAMKAEIKAAKKAFKMTFQMKLAPASASPDGKELKLTNRQETPSDTVHLSGATANKKDELVAVQKAAKEAASPIR